MYSQALQNCSQLESIVYLAQFINDLHLIRDYVPIVRYNVIVVRLGMGKGHLMFHWHQRLCIRLVKKFVLRTKDDNCKPLNSNLTNENVEASKIMLILKMTIIKWHSEKCNIG